MFYPGKKSIFNGSKGRLVIGKWTEFFEENNEWKLTGGENGCRIF